MSEQSILKIENLSVSYSSKHVIKDFSLSLDRGEHILLTGPNGSGKTTLIKCILQTVKPDSGSVKLAENTTIGYCKQDLMTESFPLSAYEVVSMGLYRAKNQSKDIVLDAMRQTNTDHLKDRSFFSLSGGEKQRISLARCLCMKPTLLLLDEPSSFLDSESKETFINILKSLDSSISAIVVTHDSQICKELNWKTYCLKETDNE